PAKVAGVLVAMEDNVKPDVEKKAPNLLQVRQSVECLDLLEITDRPDRMVEHGDSQMDIVVCRFCERCRLDALSECFELALVDPRHVLDPQFAKLLLRSCSC